MYFKFWYNNNNNFIAYLALSIYRIWYSDAKWKFALRLLYICPVHGVIMIWLYMAAVGAHGDEWTTMLTHYLPRFWLNQHFQWKTKISLCIFTNLRNMFTSIKGVKYARSMSTWIHRHDEGKTIFQCVCRPGAVAEWLASSAPNLWTRVQSPVPPC